MFSSVDLVVIAVLAFSAFVHGYAGFALGSLAMAMLALAPVGMESVAAVVTINVFVVPLVLFSISYHRQTIHWRQIAILAGGCLVGLPLGYWFIAVWGERPLFRLVLGVALVGIAILGWRGAEGFRRIPTAFAPIAGILGGFMGGAFVAGGPPLVVYLYSRAKDSRDMKATAQILFTCNTFGRLVLVGFGPSGYTPQLLRLALASLVVAIPLVFLGHRLSRHGSATRFRRAVCVLIAVLGLLCLLVTLART